jgi:hypothetical protein
MYSWHFFHLQLPILTYFWHELQQSILGMPNSIQLFKFVLESLVKSFFALFGALDDASSFDSVSRGRLL